MSFSSLFAYPTEPAPDSVADQPFLAHWTPSQWQKFFAFAQTYRYSAGDWVIRQGADDCALYLVTFGRLEAMGASAGNANQRIALIEPGGIVGEQSLLDRRRQPVGVRAVTEAETVRLSADAFEIFATREPRLVYDLTLALGCVVSLRLRAVTGSG